MTSIISEKTSSDQMLKSRIDCFFTQLNLSKMLLKCNFYKESGIHCTTMLKELFSLVFYGKNLYRTLSLQSENISFKKNTAYRFLNNSRFNWEKLLQLIMTHLILLIDRLTEQNRQSVLIFDDSLFSRNRSKKVELLAKVFDHTSHKFCKGFRMLTLGWSDGNTFLPISFKLLSSTKDENVLCEAKSMDKRTLAYKRRDQARQSTLDVMLTLLRDAKDIPAKFVLFDSWFTMPKTVIRVKKEHRDVIGMIRITEKVHYQYQGQWQNVKDIYQRIKLSDSKNIIGSACIKLREDKSAPSDEFIDARIVFIKDRRSDNWLALLCTDLSVSEEEIVRIYGKRWDIEVFFKVCKSYLSLAKEYQGRSYDMQVATTSIVFLRYAMLSQEARNATDDRTLGDLFYYLREELADIKLSQSLMLLVNTLRQVLTQLPLLSQEMADEIMNTFLNAIPHPLKQKLLLCA
ncbi:transposase [Candidatus Formimonas warabiya]|uniref:Transposase IS701-like DDE domain-containing protein n=1 Tax=Formimonas warabiya TaxID=1761012 RepID=A0A3G1KRX6_FORW1|nr:transposase [Candidatus Formimonas warabiya]ATW24797.1 hypothetical protein DCMF_08435 [Candidatus Formimonas warabiya]ATW25208.1 hypothetical protein DCMF_10910 [Candidatus Formimonas warabiya]ATW25519.1 hypothetical protein DCMF_12755 [Candidatus Formimonas warabiya]